MKQSSNTSMMVKPIEYNDTKLVDDLLTEYKEKCEEALRASINADFAQVKEENKVLKDRNTELHDTVNRLKELYDEERYKNKAIVLDNSILEIFKNQISSKETNKDKNESVYALFKLLFNKDYNERFSKEDAEEFILGCLVEFYSHKEDVIKIFNILGYKSRYDLNNFILPTEWSRDELFYFFDKIDNRSNTNGTCFEDNIQFWKGFAYNTAKEQCDYRYSNIPWQFVLRNKELKDFDFLILIGTNINRKYSGYQLLSFDKYLDLTDDEKKVVFRYIDFTNINCSSEGFNLIKRNIHLFNDKQLEIIFEICKNKYEFSCDFRFISKLPIKFIKKVIKNNPEKFKEILDKRYNEYFSIEQKEILFKIYIEALKKKEEQEN